ncbi:MAG: nucleoside triphosphate pyrophosphatase [Porticoccaceae bacterium]
MKLTLASSSPYRRQLLERFGLAFEHCAPNVDEQANPGEDPAHLAERLSIAKAQAIHTQLQSGSDPLHLIIGSDQTAVCNGRLYGKPGNAKSAAQQLTSLSGNTVVFHTGVCVLNRATQTQLSAVVSTTVIFRALDTSSITRYLEREQPFDCAGSFKAEGLGIALFEAIHSDDPTALTGLPLIRLRQLLEQSGCRVI